MDRPSMSVSHRKGRVMSNKGKVLLLASAATIFWGPGTAYAQSATAPSEAAPVLPSAEAPTDGSNAAADASSETNAAPANGEIIVTAQRRAENLQKVPIAIAAFSGDNLAMAGVSDLQGLSTIVPGFNFQSVQGWATTRLRGIGTAAAGPGIESQVALYVDDVYYASSTATLFSFNNIAQVSVLKGPQGTLFGRNAVAGLAQVTTADPSGESAFRVTAGYGNYDTVKGAAYISGAVTDDVAMDIAVVGTRQGDGYGVNLFNGHDTRRTNFDIGVRSKLVAAPTDADKLTLIFDFSSMHGSQGSIRIDPGTNPGPGTGPIYGGKVWDIDADQDGYVNTKSGGISLKYIHEFDAVTISSITAYRKSWFDNFIDLDMTETPFQAIDQHQRDRQFSQELQFQSSSGSKLRWTAGLYYFDLRSSYDPIDFQLLGGPTLNLAYPLNSIKTFGTTNARSVAGYAQASYEILPSTNLTLGGRYTWEKRDLEGRQVIGFDLGIPSLTVPFAKVSQTVKKPTWRISVDHQLSDDLLLYASYNRGFKSGGYNVGALDAPPYRPEKLDAYEAGFKATLFDRAVTLNTSAFYYDYTNVQTQEIRDDGSIGIINGAAARLYGVDFDVTARLTDNLSVNGSIELLDAKFQSFPVAPVSTPQGGVPVVAGDVSGNHMPVASPFSGTFGFNYNVPTAVGTWAISSVVNYSDGWYTEPDNMIRQGAFARVNGTIKWTSQDERYSISLWGQNLTNAKVRGNGNTEATGVHVSSFDPPRTYGFTLGYNF